MCQNRASINAFYVIPRSPWGLHGCKSKELFADVQIKIFTICEFTMYDLFCDSVIYLIYSYIDNKTTPGRRRAVLSNKEKTIDFCNVLWCNHITKMSRENSIFHLCLSESFRNFVRFSAGKYTKNAPEDRYTRGLDRIGGFSCTWVRKV